MKAVHGTLFEVDLTRGTTRSLAVPDEYHYQYLGGRGLGVRLLYDMLGALYWWSRQRSW
ncbi:MAG: hypothetical protein ABIJ48_12440 [Actinomycetota bacterium]